MIKNKQSNLKGEQMRILIVDDNVAMRDLIKEIVCTNGNEIVEASDGAEAIVDYVLRGADCVLMDIKMKKLDGIIATEVIKKIDPNSKVVIVSHYTEGELRKKAVSAGADAFVLKDNLHELSDTVKQLLGVEA
jgi:CheY-like chemotaxis protein